MLSLERHVNGQFRPALLVLAAAVGAMMLIVALNLASPQFARMTARGRGLAVRLALGASRGRVIRQALTESVSYGVTQRGREIGIRLALGASTSDVRGSIMRGTLGLALGGMALGVVGALIVVPAMHGLLFGVTWLDPASFAGASGSLIVAAALAGLFPARRAMRVDPSVVLRDG